MSTRANIILKDADGGELIFYRHHDGMPERTLPTLKEFMQKVKTGKIRDNVSQAGGWLVLIGAKEYYKTSDMDHFEDWKGGSYEPDTKISSDINYLYILDLGENHIKVCDPHYADYNDDPINAHAEKYVLKTITDFGSE